ncbi:MAG: hypothetical protein AB7Q97_11865 [Gammaproteobacteria bacterium]
MHDFMYGMNSALIAAVLFASMVAALEVGYRVGRVRMDGIGEPVRSHVNAVQGSMLGVLALLLGFTLSLALQRFDSRSEAVVSEANAIGTAYLRAALLPGGPREEAVEALRAYLDVRVRAGAVSLDHEPTRLLLAHEANATLDRLWNIAVRAAEVDKSPATTGLFIQALNEAIDAWGHRDAELSRHVPEPILLLLYVTFVITAGVVGYGTGLANHRPPGVTYLLLGLIVVLAFIIVDLDRPRRGLLRIDQSSLQHLAQAMDAAAQPAAPGAAAPRTAVTGRP